MTCSSSNLPAEWVSPWPQHSALSVATHETSGMSGGTDYGALLESIRRLQSRLVASTPPSAIIHELIAQISTLSELVTRYVVPEAERWDGRRVDLPGRGHLLLPPYVIDEDSGTTMGGSITFSRFHLGGGGAVHGGVLPLLFDDLLGRVSSYGQAGMSRTAYLKVDYRIPTPIESGLRFAVWQGVVAGRKRYAHGRLLDSDGRILAEAEALFVGLRPSQA